MDPRPRRPRPSPARRAFAAAVVTVSSALLGGCATDRNALRPAPDRDPMEGVAAQRLYQQGEALAARGDLVRAEQYLAESIERGYDERRGLPLLLRVCVASQRYRAAIVYAAHWLDRHPNDWALRFLVATIHEELGEHFTARRHFETVLAANDRHAGAHYFLGSILRSAYSDPRAADVHFRRYLELEPRGAHADEARSGVLHDMVPTESPAPATTAAATPAATPVTTLAPAATPPPSAPAPSTAGARAPAPAAPPRPRAAPEPPRR